MKFKHLINYITINFLSPGNFTSIKYLRRKCNLIVDLSKFISNKNILSKIAILCYNQACNLLASQKKEKKFVTCCKTLFIKELLSIPPPPPPLFNLKTFFIWKFSIKEMNENHYLLSSFLIFPK